MRHAEIVYYTGTGNTLRALAIIAKELENNGWTVSMTDIGTGTVPAPLEHGPALGPDDLLVVGFPTLGFSAPASVFRYLGRLRRASAIGMKATRAAIVCACGASARKSGGISNGWSGTATRTVAAALSRHGCRTVASVEISYTENWTQFSNPHVGKISEAMTAAGDAQAAAFGADLAAGRFHTVRRGLAGTAFGLPVGWLFRTAARHLLSRMFTANRTCTSCGLCAAVCPSGAIAMREGKPAWNFRCTACNRCINVCPVGAIQTTYARLVLIGGLNVAIMIAAWPLARAAVTGIAPALAGPAVLPATLALDLLFYILGSLIQLGPFERLVRKLEAVPSLSRLFGKALTSSYNRYLAVDFKPGKSPYRKP